jgi:hypothetical protein
VICEILALSSRKKRKEKERTTWLKISAEVYRMVLQKSSHQKISLHPIPLFSLSISINQNKTEQNMDLPS